MSADSLQASHLSTDLCRLARFGANISDAHSCFIFLPSSILNPDNKSTDSHRILELGGFHSLSNEIVGDCCLVSGHGLIGWVAKHNRSIHVSPFERDSRTLGVYSSDQLLKSFIGIPLKLTCDPEEDSSSQSSEVGVIACDSRKSFAFSKLQGKLLEDLAAEVANTVRLKKIESRRGFSEVCWRQFLHSAAELQAALGVQALEVLRVKVDNAQSLEQKLGASRWITAHEQLYRLIQQSVPPHFPSIKLPHGDMILIVDTMMASFYQQRIQALAERVGTNQGRPELSFASRAFRSRKSKNLSLEELISETAQTETIELRRNVASL